VLLVLLSCVAAPVPAWGSTVAVTLSVETRYGDTSRDGPPRQLTVGSIAVTAAPRERNDLRTAVQTGDLRVSDGAGLIAGAGCRQLSPTDALCDYRDELKSLTADLADLDDRADVAAARAMVAGGAGDDVLAVGNGDAAGGPGADLLVASGALDGGPGPDVLRSAIGPNGTASSTTVFYGDRTAPVTVTPGTGADDGEAGEGDDVGADLRMAIGGAGDDHLVAPDGPGGMLAGGAGNDLLVGATGDDVLSGQAGNDTIRGGVGDDRLEGGAGRDVISGERGDDRILGSGFDRLVPADGTSSDVLYGGPGDDMLVGGPEADGISGGGGRDVIEGGGGRDGIEARDGQLDLVGCAVPRLRVSSSRALVDASDLVRGCGALEREGIGRAQVVFAGPHELDDDVGVAVGCPQDVRPSCRVRLRLSGGTVPIAETRSVVRPGRARQLALVLDKRRLRRVPVDPPSEGKPAFCGTQALRLTLTTVNARGRRVTLSYPLRLGSTGIGCGYGFVDDLDSGWDPA